LSAQLQVAVLETSAFQGGIACSRDSSQQSSNCENDDGEIVELLLTGLLYHKQQNERTSFKEKVSNIFFPREKSKADRFVIVAMFTLSEKKSKEFTECYFLFSLL
jgi:hypothetical protein